MRCNATLTTATVEPCDTPGPQHVCTGSAAGLTPPLMRDGEKVHVTFHTLTCGWDHDDDQAHCTEQGDDSVWWFDGTPGASPHVDPLVTDEEVDAALNVLWPNEPHANGTVINVRRALEAAARFRPEAR